MKFSATYRPTALFSLRSSNATSSGAKSLLLPSPYAIKMAFLSQAISLGGEAFDQDANHFAIVRDAKISYRIEGNMCANNCFVKIQKQRDGSPFSPTVSYREYILLDGDVEIIFDVAGEAEVAFLKRYLYRINYFGKRGCFFQFIAYSDTPNEPNVRIFDVKDPTSGLLQEYDDFENNLTFVKVNSYSELQTSRSKTTLVLPLKIANSSKSYTSYKLM
jgi:hypothetical protein